MRRGRGKGKRQNASTREDLEEEEKIPAYRRRGRPQKPVKDETVGEEEIVEKDDDDDDDTYGSVTSKEEVKENNRKRKEPIESKESNITEEKNGLRSKSSTDDSVKLSGFRQIGSRRKNKPRRAAEAVVECNDGV